MKPVGATYPRQEPQPWDCIHVSGDCSDVEIETFVFHLSSISLVVNIQFLS
jgi:hypothetical protein